MVNLIREGIVKIRKTHQCLGCLRKFDAGTKMHYQCCADSGDIYNVYVCDTCEKLKEYFESDEGNWPEGYVSEEFNSRYYPNIKTPEEFLQMFELKEHIIEVINET